MLGLPKICVFFFNSPFKIQKNESLFLNGVDARRFKPWPFSSPKRWRSLNHLKDSRITIPQVKTKKKQSKRSQIKNARWLCLFSLGWTLSTRWCILRYPHFYNPYDSSRELVIFCWDCSFSLLPHLVNSGSPQPLLGSKEPFKLDWDKGIVGMVANEGQIVNLEGRRKLDKKTGNSDGTLLYSYCWWKTSCTSG